MRILALDMGEKRIGVAVSDALGITANARESIKYKSSQDAIDSVLNIAKDEQATEIVVGLPLNINGTQSNFTKKVIEFTEQLKKKTDVPVATWDERLTSMEGERVLLEADMTRKKRKQVIDKVAAQLILQNYLNFKKNV
jgi:putative Holliday junction resolvase